MPKPKLPLESMKANGFEDQEDYQSYIVGELLEHWYPGHTSGRQLQTLADAVEVVANAREANAVSVEEVLWAWSRQCNPTTYQGECIAGTTTTPPVEWWQQAHNVISGLEN